MGVASAPDLIASIRQLGLLDAEPLATLAQSPASKLPPKDLARELVNKGLLTPFQANQLLNGRGKELLLGEYVILETIGKGGMGQVFKARQRRLKRLAALKVIRKEFLSNPTTVARFLREAESAARLAHPNIVTVYDAGESQGVHYLAMEFIDGTNLGDMLKSGPMPVPTACDYVRQAALGLQHAHEQGMVHRDLKPHNLMLTKQGYVKVLDMGLARLVQQSSPESRTEAMTENGSVLGTPDYIAPEQAKDARTIDIRADIYSLGCTLYHMLGGRPPFHGESLTETLLKHHLEEPTPIEDLRGGLPGGLPEVVRKLMAKRPQDRYQTPAAAAEALAPYCNASAGSGTRLPPSAPRPRAGSRSPLVPLLIGGGALAALLLLSVGVIAAYFLLRAPSNPSVADSRPTDKDKARPKSDGGERPKKDRTDKSITDGDKIRKDADRSPKDGDKTSKDGGEKTAPRLDAPDVSKLPLLFEDRFSNPVGFPVRKDRGHECGYADGRYFIRINQNTAGWHNGRTFNNFACRVVGRATGPATGGWGVSLISPKDQNRGVFLAISREGKLQVLPSPFAQGAAATTGPRIAPFRHTAIKTGDDVNELLTVLRGKKLEVYVNSVAVCDPIVLDRELPDAVTALMAFTQSNQETRAEFSHLTVWSLEGS